jgi:hypothetical protein
VLPCAHAQKHEKYALQSVWKQLSALAQLLCRHVLHAVFCEPDDDG